MRINWLSVWQGLLLTLCAVGLGLRLAWVNEAFPVMPAEVFRFATDLQNVPVILLMVMAFGSGVVGRRILRILWALFAIVALAAAVLIEWRILEPMRHRMEREDIIRYYRPLGTASDGRPAAR